MCAKVYVSHLHIHVQFIHHRQVDSGIILNLSPTLWRQGLSVKPELTYTAKCQWPACPGATHSAVICVYMGFQESELRSSCLAAGALTTEPSPQPNART